MSFTKPLLRLRHAPGGWIAESKMEQSCNEIHEPAAWLCCGPGTRAGPEQHQWDWEKWSCDSCSKSEVLRLRGGLIIKSFLEEVRV